MQVAALFLSMVTTGSSLQCSSWAQPRSVFHFLESSHKSIYTWPWNKGSDTFDSLWMASCLDGLQPHPLKKHKLANQNTNSRAWVKHKCGINARNAALALCMSTHWPILLAFQKLAVGVDLHIQSQLDIQQFLVLIELLLHAVPHLCHLALLGVHLSTVLVSVAGQHVLQLTNPFLCSCSLNQIQSTLMLSWYNWLVLPSLPLWAWWHVLLS